MILVYRLKTPLAANPLSFFRFNRPFAMNVLKTSMPAAINEVLWSVGITSYNAVYARIGTDAIAAVNINATIEELVFVLFIGLGNACAVMVGNKIGAGEKHVAFEYGRRFMILGVTVALIGGAIVFSLRETIIRPFEISPSAADNLRGLMLVFALSAWLKMLNFILFIGAMRAGDSHAMFMELFDLPSVPAALIGGFVLHLPGMEFTRRYCWKLPKRLHPAVFSRRWIHDLANVGD
jgi:Na+-driven multidrug efflux pump